MAPENHRKITAKLSITSKSAKNLVEGRDGKRHAKTRLSEPLVRVIATSERIASFVAERGDEKNNSHKKKAVGAIFSFLWLLVQFFSPPPCGSWELGQR